MQDLQPGPIISQAGKILGWGSLYPGSRSSVLQVFIARLVPAVGINTDAMVQGTLETWIKSRFPMPITIYSDFQTWVLQFTQNNPNALPMLTFDLPPGQIFPNQTDLHFWQWAWGQAVSKAQAPAQVSGTVSGPCPDCGQDHGQVGAAAVQIPRTSLNASTALGGLWKATGVKSAAAVNKELKTVLWEAPCEFFALRADEGLPYISKNVQGVPATYMGALLTMINVWNLLPSITVPPSQIASVIKVLWPTPAALVAELSKVESTTPGGNPFHVSDNPVFTAQSLCNFMRQGEFNLFTVWPFMQHIVLASIGYLFPPGFGNLELAETFTWNEVFRAESSYELGTMIDLYYKRVRDVNDLMVATPSALLSIKKKIQTAVPRPFNYRMWYWAAHPQSVRSYPADYKTFRSYLTPPASDVHFWKWVWKIANGNISNQELIARNQAGFHFPKPPVIA